MVAGVVIAGALFGPPPLSGAGAGGAFVSSAAAADFTFRRVRPPKPGARKRIILQDRGGVAVGARKAPAYKWFWDVTGTTVEAASPARLTIMGGHYEAKKPGQFPGLGSVSRARQVLSDHGDAIATAARAHGVSPALILAVIAVESAGKPRATSPKGAQGLMQLIPATAERFGVSNAYDPAQNIAGGAAYLDVLLRLFKEDALLALAGYNAGENAVLSRGGVPPFRETRAYVAKVVGAFQQIRKMCAVPPTTARGDCAFTTG